MPATRTDRIRLVVLLLCGSVASAASGHRTAHHDMPVAVALAAVALLTLAAITGILHKAYQRG
jgi:hypothetical protein